MSLRVFYFVLLSLGHSHCGRTTDHFGLIYDVDLDVVECSTHVLFSSLVRSDFTKKYYAVSSYMVGRMVASFV